MTAQLPIDDRTHVLLLTGAGVSAESGIPTFRDAAGLWESHRMEDVASPEGFRRDPILVWRFYSERRARAKECAPNAGHAAIAALERRLGDRFLLATQNVDGLHLRAGSQRVVELHGNLFRSRCSVCDRAPIDDEEVYSEADIPGCSRCNERGELALLRPDIVWFGEMLDPAHLDRVERFMIEAARARFVFIAAGTSGVVSPASGFVHAARGLGAETWLVNLEPPANARAFDHFAAGKSGEILPGLFGV